MFDMTKRTTKQVHLGIKVPEDLKLWVENEADKKMLSISDIVRQAILEKKERVEHGNV